MAAMHWGTFDLTDEPADLAPRVLRQVVRERGGDPERVHVVRDRRALAPAARRREPAE